MFIKEKIRFKGNDVKLRVSLTANDNLNGLQESINEYVERETGLSINPATDGETFRLRNSLGSKTFVFQFYNGSTYSSELLNAGFTTDDFETRSLSIQSSFFIMQVYDSVNTENQTLLHSGFLNGYNFTNSSSVYQITSEKEFDNIYIEQNFIDSQSGNTFYVYAKFFFFNAKLGKLHSFYNHENESLTTEHKLYYPIEINKSLKQYKFYKFPVSPTTIFCKELVNADYNERLNTTLDTFGNEKPTYPTGTIFTNSGTYE